MENDVDTKYDLAGQIRKHKWSLKLSLRLFNMNFNNTYRICMALMEKHNWRRWLLSMSGGIKKSAQVFLQRSKKMSKRAVDHPLSVRDLQNAHGIGCQKKKSKDLKGVMITQRSTPIEKSNTLYKSINQQKANA